MRVFLDTNVLVSAFATRGLCSDLLRSVLAEHELITGEVILVELRRSLRNRIKLPSSTVSGIEQFLKKQIVVPKPSKPHPLEIKDPDDKWVLATAVAGDSDVLVTGDSDLLEVESRAPLRIMTPREFWDMLREESGA